MTFELVEKITKGLRSKGCVVWKTQPFIYDKQTHPFITYRAAFFKKRNPLWAFFVNFFWNESALGFSLLSHVHILSHTLLPSPPSFSSFINASISSLSPSPLLLLSPLSSFINPKIFFSLTLVSLSSYVSSFLSHPRGERRPSCLYEEKRRRGVQEEQRTGEANKRRTTTMNSLRRRRRWRRNFLENRRSLSTHDCRHVVAKTLNLIIIKPIDLRFSILIRIPIYRRN